MEYYIGQIFECQYPVSAAVWCNENNAFIEELEPIQSTEEQQEIISEAVYDEKGVEIKPTEYKSVTIEVTVRRFQIVAIPEPTFAEVKGDAIARIDAATSAAILAGFDYEIGGESLHFSYDSFDQQNFADTANVATLAISGAEGLPTSVTWNAYRNYSAETGGELVRLTLDPQAFLMLYTSGALAHKATQMEIGGQCKAAIEAAESVEAIQALLAEWGI